MSGDFRLCHIDVVLLEACDRDVSHLVLSVWHRVKFLWEEKSKSRKIFTPSV